MMTNLAESQGLAIQNEADHYAAAAVNQLLAIIEKNLLCSIKLLGYQVSDAASCCRAIIAACDSTGYMRLSTMS